MLFFPFFNAALKYVIMPFFVPLCDAYAPVIFLDYGPFMYWADDGKNDVLYT